MMDLSKTIIHNTKIPKVKDCVQIRHSWDGIEILIHDDEGKFGFKRIDNRWRFISGPYCSVHHVASAVFDYSNNPSNIDIDFMVNCLSCFCKLADSFCIAIKDYHERRFKELSQNKELLDVVADSTKKNDFLYLIKHVNGLVKIGRSVRPTTREKTLQAEDPKLYLIAQFQNCGKHEKRLHRIFSDFRVRGEWFDLNTRHIDWIQFVFASHH